MGGKNGAIWTLPRMRVPLSRWVAAGKMIVSSITPLLETIKQKCSAVDATILALVIVISDRLRVCTQDTLPGKIAVPSQNRLASHILPASTGSGEYFLWHVERG
jgi:hypothetical protein